MVLGGGAVSDERGTPVEQAVGNGVVAMCPWWCRGGVVIMVVR